MLQLPLQLKYCIGFVSLIPARLLLGTDQMGKGNLWYRTSLTGRRPTGSEENKCLDEWSSLFAGGTGHCWALGEGQRQVSVRLAEHQIELQWQQRQQGGGVLSHDLCCSAGTPTASQLPSVGSARLDPGLRNDGKMLNAVQ